MQQHQHTSISLREREALIEAARHRAQVLRREAIIGFWDALARWGTLLWSLPTRAARSPPAPRRPCA